MGIGPDLRRPQELTLHVSRDPINRTVAKLSAAAQAIGDASRFLFADYSTLKANAARSSLSSDFRLTARRAAASVEAW
jgi:hypothetical protein